MKEDKKINFLDSLGVSSLLSFTLLFFTPLQIYLTNILEFNFQFPQILFYLLFLAAVAGLGLGLFLWILPRWFSLRQRAHSLVFVLAFLLWLQANILVWNYGPLDGRAIDWHAMLFLGILDASIWAALLLLSWIQFSFFNRIRRRAALVLVLLQTLAVVFYYVNAPPIPNFNSYAFDIEKKFTYSNQRNVIILLIDCFQSDVFQETLNEDASIRETFKGFTYFRNNLGGFPVTYASVPLLLTGKYYDNSIPIQEFIRQAYLSPSSLPLALKQHGVVTDLFPASMNVVYWDYGLVSNLLERPYAFFLSNFGQFLDIDLFRSLPHFLKRPIYNDQKWWIKNLLPNKTFSAKKMFKGWLGQAPKPKPKKNPPNPASLAWRIRLHRTLPQAGLGIRDVNFVSSAMLFSTAEIPAPVFKFYHWMGVHSPFRMNEAMEPEVLPDTRASWKRQVRGELKLVELFFKVLKFQKIFDNALIFVIGDHGHPRGDFGWVLPPDLAAMNQGTATVPAGVIASAAPLLLAKRSFEKGELKISDAPVTIADIAKTVLSELNIANDNPGESLYEVRENQARKRFYYFYTWTPNDWNSQYLPELSEYSIQGHSWLNQSWQATGRILRRPE